MTIMLSSELSQQWREGGWLSLEVQETILEDITHQQITEPVYVLLDNGTSAFGVRAGRIV
jgi:hypothetical protein